MNTLISETESDKNFINKQKLLKIGSVSLYLNNTVYNNNLSSLDSFSMLIGTPLYKGNHCEGILKTITGDFYNNNLEIDNIKGNYVFFFIREGKIYILQDKTKQISLFYDKKTKSISSSLLQLAKLRNNNLKLDKDGLFERLAIGFNLSENTIFEDIIKITPENQELLQKELNIEFLQHQKNEINSIKFHNEGKEKSIQCQLDHLSRYFQLIDKTFENKTGDLGLSGGFDCRLLLALAKKKLNTKLHLHTHFTEGVHESQIKYAMLLANEYDQDLTKIKTISPTKLSDVELTKMMDENLTFFDGRSARHLGAYSQTYTEWYKKESMDNAFYSLNGLGGEIYRDSYFTGTKKMNWDDWARRYLFLPLTNEVLPEQILSELSFKLKTIIKRELNWTEDYYDILFTHAYYGLIKMPQCNGNLVSAYNKVSPFLLPFVEPDNVMEALKAIFYIGVGGKYQAEMMKQLSYNIAQIPNSYGNSFVNLGCKHLFWSYIKTIGGVGRRERLVNKKLKNKAQSTDYSDFLKALYSIEIMEKSFERLKNYLPESNIRMALVDSSQRRNVIFNSYLLYKYF